ncbi:4-amino-4-deoxy-L-arabinose transferase [Arachidicoccus rhizosphaerae]|uniref:4-amino-4-deoxy-L-arabinose transferase n=1 Tax=Arachidicoccus rhizosphaerae TaxID=551991 RepID=A0A1H3W6D3_9BACT|nr:glycosyltransferase family 39 protein [Arachidicoccus rhizosphaerae]SDZ82645.1 4-amino-4-deoxy-L-arabinose transferase [Arachidicoccus rhizosphaerae]
MSSTNHYVSLSTDFDNNPSSIAGKQVHFSDKILLYLLALLIVFIPFLLLNGYYEPHRDEFLYLAEGNHLSWGFMEVPPMLSLISSMIHWMGGSMFWIRFWPGLFGGATFLLAGSILLSLGGRKLGLLLLYLPFLCGVYLRLFLLFQPNSLEVFFDTLCAFSIIRFIQTRGIKWLYLFGVSAGLGMLSKYSVGVFIISLVIGLLLGKQRHVIFNRHFWYATLIGIIIFLPNLLWQFHHGLPVVHHMELLNKYQLQYIDRMGFLKDQLLMNLATVYIWVAGLLYLLWGHKFRPYQFIAIAYLSVLTILMMLHGKNYYALGAYPFLFSFGALAIENWFRKGKKVVVALLICFSVVLGFWLVPLMIPVFEPVKLAAYYQKMGVAKTGALKWEDLKDHALPQDFADMQGWREMAAKVQKAYNLLTPQQKQHTIIFCDNYGQAGAVDYYRKLFDLPEPLSTNASYLYWIPDHLSMNLQNIVLVTDDQQEMSHPFIKQCREAVLVDSITTPYAKERGSLIILFKDINDTFKAMIKTKIENEKSVFKKK